MKAPAPATVMIIAAVALCAAAVVALRYLAPSPSTATRPETMPAATIASAPLAPRGDPSVLARDPVRLQTALDRYASIPEEDERGALLASLGMVGGDTVRAFALSLLAQDDPAKRSRGLDLLATFPLDAEGVREAVAAGLDGERDPALLGRYVDLAVPTVLPPDDAVPMSASLQRLTMHADAAVRARSVPQAAQWSTSDEDVEVLLNRAMLDDAPEVRRAAVAGIIATRSRSPRLKDALLWLAADRDATAEDRSAALFALQWYPLTAADYSIYHAADAELAAHEH